MPHDAAPNLSHLVDEEGLAYMRALEALGPQDYEHLSARKAREAVRSPDWKPPANARRVTISAARGCTAVLYSPTSTHTPKHTGIVVYLHGGGFVVGDAGAADPICGKIASEANCYVLSVEYRLAPEAPFPAAVDDALCALRWAAQHALSGGWSRRGLIMAGQSAGGNLAAVAAQCWRGQPLRLQLLVCPLTDFRPKRHASRIALADNVVLSAEVIEWLEQRYLPSDADRYDPRASPLAAKDLRGLPAAHVIVASGDPLCDEGEAYALALHRAGVAVTYERYPSVHGFMSLYADLHQGRLAMQSSVRAIQTALAELER